MLRSRVPPPSKCCFPAAAPLFKAVSINGSVGTLVFVSPFGLCNTVNNRTSNTHRRVVCVTVILWLNSDMENSTLHRDLRAFMRSVVILQADGVLCGVRTRPKNNYRAERFAIYETNENILYCLPYESRYLTV